MLTISDFSEICYPSPQTPRYHHSEGLLLPADVDPWTGYRSYTFEQVEQAKLVTSLRGTGMGIRLVRRALDEPDEAPAGPRRRGHGRDAPGPDVVGPPGPRRPR